jgi:putative MATE family efflux protein
MTGMLSHTFINAVDTAMVGRLGAPQLAAVGIGGLFYIVIGLTLAGIAIGVQAMTARRQGAGRFPEAGATLINALWIVVPAGLVLTFLFVCGTDVLSRVLFVSPETRVFGAVYVKYRFLGLFFFAVTAACRGFFNGITATRYYMYTALTSCIANIVLDYGLIFGRLGMPCLGVKGAAVASTLSEGIGVLCYVAAVMLPRHWHRYFRQNVYKPDRAVISGLVGLSVPASVRTFVDMGSFLVFIWIIGLLGVAELAAANVIRSIAGFAFLPAVGLGIGTSALLGNALGAGDPDDAGRIAREAVKIAVLFMTGCCVLFCAVPRALFLIYTTDPTVIAKGLWPLRIMGVSLVMSAFAIILSSALRSWPFFWAWALPAPILPSWSTGSCFQAS